MNLRHLSDTALERKLSDCTQQERQALACLLFHLKEFDSRKLFLKHGYSSLFEYLTVALKYTNGSAQRRIEAARLLRVAPEIAEKIEDGRLQLTNVAELARAIKQKEAESKIKIRSEEKRRLIAVIEDVSVPEAQRNLAKELDLRLKPLERKTVQKDESVNIQLTLTKEQYERLLQCRDLASHTLTQNGEAGLADTISYVCEQFVKAKTGRPQISSPKKPTTTAESRVSTSIVEVDLKSTASSTNEKMQSEDSANRGDTNKTITSRTRRLILTKYKHCQHVDPKSGRKCGHTFLLQVDHIRPRWAGGDNSFENLTLLCATHNQEKYRRQSSIAISSG